MYIDGVQNKALSWNFTCSGFQILFWFQILSCRSCESRFQTCLGVPDKSCSGEQKTGQCRPTKVLQNVLKTKPFRHHLKCAESYESCDCAIIFLTFGMPTYHMLVYTLMCAPVGTVGAQFNVYFTNEL